MRAAYYEKNGSARDVLRVAEVETPQPGPGEVRIKLKTSGVNPSDVKAREGQAERVGRAARRRRSPSPVSRRGVAALAQILSSFAVFGSCTVRLG
jgi:NADPH:quinone reductase-like Zn-dependent oxidoreductase